MQATPTNTSSTTIRGPSPAFSSAGDRRYNDKTLLFTLHLTLPELLKYPSRMLLFLFKREWLHVLLFLKVSGSWANGNWAMVGRRGCSWNSLTLFCIGNKFSESDWIFPVVKESVKGSFSCCLCLAVPSLLTLLQWDIIPKLLCLIMFVPIYIQFLNSPREVDLSLKWNMDDSIL